jgi:hypothetical protein
MRAVLSKVKNYPLNNFQKNSIQTLFYLRWESLVQVLFCCAEVLLQEWSSDTGKDVNAVEWLLFLAGVISAFALCGRMARAGTSTSDARPELGKLNSAHHFVMARRLGPMKVSGRSAPALSGDTPDSNYSDNGATPTTRRLRGIPAKHAGKAGLLYARAE